MNDIKLLKAIENNARTSLKELSLMLNESEEDISKLEKIDYVFVNKKEKFQLISSLF